MEKRDKERTRERERMTKIWGKTGSKGVHDDLKEEH